MQPELGGSIRSGLGRSRLSYFARTRRGHVPPTTCAVNSLNLLLAVIEEQRSLTYASLWDVGLGCGPL